MTYSTVGDRVWLDSDGDGIQDSGEAGISGVTVKLLTVDGATIGTATTNSNGNYSFSGILPDHRFDYRVEFVRPAGYELTGQNLGGSDAKDSDADPATGRTGVHGINHGQTDLSIDAGMYRPATIGDRVFVDADADGVQDSGEQGLGGVTVRLLNAGGAVVGTTTTAGGGAYGFANVAPGTYSVEFVAPSGYAFTGADRGGDDARDSDANGATGRTGQVTVTSGGSNTTLDAGLVQLASIGDRVFEDADADGVQDAGETGDAGVTVRLLDATGATTLRTATTDSNGVYGFSGLMPGDYRIEVAKPAGTSVSTADAGSDDSRDSDANAAGRTGAYALSAGENDATADVGLFRTAALGDRVFADADADGVQDAGEAGLGGVTVKLLDQAGTVASTTTTDSAGHYNFAGLKPGAYSVAFVAPAGYVFSAADQRGDDATDSDADAATGRTGQVTLASGGANATLDAGLVALASIGDRVWEDSNGDGVQDAGEAGIGGVTVRLLDQSGGVVATCVTGADGGYGFTGLVPGDYRLEVVKPAGYAFTGQNQGGDDGRDSDAAATGRTALYRLDAGENDLSVDVGLVRPATIGDYVWLDADRDGRQDGDESGLAGVIVRLLDASGDVIASTTSSAAGAYSFADVAPGEYSVAFVAPSGYVFTGADQAPDALDSDADAATGRTGSVTVTSGGSDTTLDAGFYRPAPPATASLGDLVFLDADRDGVQDTDEGGLAGATVRLLGPTGTAVLATATTDADGHYAFTGLAAGDYRVQFVTPSGYVLSQQNATANDTKDSDAGAGGLTGIYRLAAGESDRSVDAGLFLAPATPPGDGSYDDLIEAGDGADRIYGGRGNDEMQGEGGDDLISGGTDNGRVVGTADTLSMEIGDNLYGNDGRDAFLYARGDGVDAVWDFQPGQDIIEVAGHALANVAVTTVREVTNRIGMGSHEKLAIVFDGGRGATVFNDFPNPGSTAPAIRFADGSSLSAAQFVAMASANRTASGPQLDPTASDVTWSSRAGIEQAGTNDGDWLVGGAGNDRLYGNEGINQLEGLAGDDALFGGNVADTLLGGVGNDNGYGNGGDDVIVGGAGNDKLYGAGGVDIIYGDDEDGAQTLIGGAGNNRFSVDNASDRIVERAGSGRDVADVTASTFALGASAEVETLRSAVTSARVDVLLVGSKTDNAITGHAGKDTLKGLGGDDAISGGLGNDQLDGGTGNDSLDGGLGNDWMIGGLGRDVLKGGAGADVFDFNTAAESGRGSARDVVYFERRERDELDLAGIDAREDRGGDQAFAWIGSAAFSGIAGQLRFDGGVVSGDTDGDRRSDFEIRLVGSFGAGDMIL